MLFGIGYYAILNLLGFYSMAADKKKAKKHEWRTPEKTLLLIAFLGGALGSFIGMQMMRHKTKHAQFVILVPLFLILHIGLIGFLLYKFH